MLQVKCKVVHSRTKAAWNVINDGDLGKKYKIARVPYEVSGKSDEASVKLDARERQEAYEIAEYIAKCVSNKDAIDDARVFGRKK